MIQGPEVEPATRSTLPPGETKIRISLKVLAAAVEALKERRSHGKTSEGAAQPEVFLDSDGYAVVQGPEVESGTRSSLVNLLPGETGVRISTEVLTAAVAALERR